MVIDHIGRIDVGEGLRGQTFTVLRRLLDRGNIWVKLSGTDRISKQAYPYADAVPFSPAISLTTRPSAWSGAPTGRIPITTPSPMTAIWSI